MGIGIIDNFSLSHTKFLDERQSYPDLVTLQANTTVKMPKGMEVYVEDTGKWYVMSCTNADDPTTYVWTERPSGGGASSFSELTGDPMDNTALASALNEKADTDDVYIKTEADSEFLSSNLGSENVGKVLGIDSEGDVVPVTGGSGTMNYEELLNKPTINDVELVGDLTDEDLNLAGTQKGYSKNLYNKKAL